MLFENYNFFETKNNNKLDTITNGFNKGNMFKNEYIGYKKYTPKMPKLKNEKEKELFHIMELSFALNDLNLYLDINPTDSKMFNTFQEINKELEKKELEYAQKYNSLELSDINTKYDWASNFPWQEGRDSKYV